LAAGIDAPDGGRVPVDDVDLTSLSSREAASYRLDVLG
jgi:ABC-type lipoprotein export system ATPase subunit